MADQTYQQKRADLLRDIDAGMADIVAGRISGGEDVFAEIEGAMDMTDTPDDFDRLMRDLDGHLRELEPRIAAGEVTSPAVINMARGLREALDRYFQSGNDGK
jgi:hypothetical protein